MDGQRQAGRQEGGRATRQHSKQTHKVRHGATQRRFAPVHQPPAAQKPAHLHTGVSRGPPDYQCLNQTQHLTSRGQLLRAVLDPPVTFAAGVAGAGGSLHCAPKQDKMLVCDMLQSGGYLLRACDLDLLTTRNPSRVVV